MNRRELRDSSIRTSQDLAKLAEKLGYGKGGFGQLIFNNGATATSLLDFFDDNPGAIDAVVQFVDDNLHLYDGFEEDTGEDEEEDFETEEG